MNMPPPSVIIIAVILAKLRRRKGDGISLLPTLEKTKTRNSPGWRGLLIFEAFMIPIA